MMNKIVWIINISAVTKYVIHQSTWSSWTASFAGTDIPAVSRGFVVEVLCFEMLFKSDEFHDLAVLMKTRPRERSHIPYQSGTFEDEKFLFRRVGYVMVPWRV